MHRLAIVCSLAAVMISFALGTGVALAARLFHAALTIVDVRPALERIAFTLGLAPAAFAYAGPDAPASLRHEAGTHRRSAARNV